ncbi:ubiquitin-specific protease otu1 [Dipsacomyces acuminosporus]|nr:ubiquitin-specific protease otu1 [Dipsacomyces acuminosporus]
MAPEGIKNVNISGLNLTVGTLKQKISAATSIPLHALSIRFGFPPRVLDVCDNTPISETPVKDGSVLTIVNEDTPSLHEQTAAPVSHEHHTHSFAPSEPATARSVQPEHTHRHSGSVNEDGAYVSVGEGYLARRQVPSDNNCLFHALAGCLGDKVATPERLRSIVCDEILRDNESYNEAVLGMPVGEYCQWIMKSTSWGGAIELAIFCDHLQTEICSVDIQTLRIDRFGEGRYPQRVILFYSGVHYDFAAFTFDKASPREFDLTVFGIDESGDEMLAAARELADKLRQKHEFTDTANFSLRCNQCNTLLRGEREAQEHSMGTLHTNYSEV